MVTINYIINYQKILEKKFPLHLNAYNLCCPRLYDKYIPIKLFNLKSLHVIFCYTKNNQEKFTH